jgi:hypothetical protein
VRHLLDKPLKRDAVAASVADYSWDRNGQALSAHWREIAGR